MRDQSIYEINSPNRNTIHCISNRVTLRYLIPPQLDIYIVNRVIIIAARLRIEQIYSFERVLFFLFFFLRTQNKRQRKEMGTGKHGDSRGMKSAGTSRCSRFPVPSSTCQLLPNIRYSISRCIPLLAIMYVIA